MSVKTTNWNGNRVLNQENITLKLTFILSLLPRDNTYKLCDNVKEEVSETVPWERR